MGKQWQQPGPRNKAVRQPGKDWQGARAWQGGHAWNANWTEWPRGGASSAKAWKKEADDPDVAISKYLSAVLRHNAVELKLDMRKDGYVKAKEVLELPFLQEKGVDEQELTRLVESNAKKRFGLSHIDGELYIRAHQGHSLQQVQDVDLLEEITTFEEEDVLCHGTFWEPWQRIQEDACLRTMGRNHIHLVSKDLTREEFRNTVISGARGEFDVIVFIVRLSA
ncbi:unnamed protein product [Effrenium voratum]|uniref:2'-phosphotransferase n=1 Tax=Effrenium voratum TaxID=2562239 RepID=A0AA36JAT1_9DINO|nr:unnamed protein product [Effrenium voratum]CAJ1401820.1 unnamed protein product [Effrenium voratum]CAJ1423743.1 unnamed protein product [Effrenium voratum]